VNVRRLDDGGIAVPAWLAALLMGVYTRTLRMDVLSGRADPVPAEVRELDRLLRGPAPAAVPARCRGVGTITAAEAAARRGCTSRQIRRLCASGRIPARRAGGVWLVDAAAVAGPDSDV
jgi:excisionase family DNA binding protein